MGQAAMPVLSRSGRRALAAAGVFVALFVGSLSFVATTRVAADSLPSKLSDQEFWKLVTDVSEPNGFFRSDNLLSNEQTYQHVIPDLVKASKAGRVYLGVGPEQNFAYISALKPSMVFIVDVRRGNLDLHLMYKALFELSADRADFVGRLFAKKRPSGLTTKSRADEIFSAYWNVDTSDDLYNENLAAIQNHLTSGHQFDLSLDDMRGIEYVYHAFYWFGPRIRYSSSGNFGGPFQPTYTDLMTATDASGEFRGYLASEESFQFLKALEARNLVVPVVGNFSGSKAIRTLGQYLRQKGAKVSAFYLSNVEDYLKMDGVWRDFCVNVASLPLDESSTFIRSVRPTSASRTYGLVSELAGMLDEVKGCR